MAGTAVLGRLNWLAAQVVSKRDQTHRVRSIVFECPKWEGHGRRIDAAILSEFAGAPDDRPSAYVCGPTGFVEVVADCLVDLGHHAESIRTERFGPTG